MAEWRFPSNDFGENKGINDSGVAMFRGTPVKSLAREICQNSLDAAAADKVRVEFSLFDMPTKDIPGRDALKDTFERCLEFWKAQTAVATKTFFTKAIADIDKPTCTILRISDFNTKGLTGSREEINTNWTNLTKSSGASDKNGSAGGSYGIGKYATFACSSMSTVYYSTYDEKEEEAYQGVSRIVTFTRADGQNTQGIGYYGNDKNTPVYEQLSMDPSFARTRGEHGTDIYIIGYNHGGPEWKTELISSILDGFLGAIWNEKLEVVIGDEIITKDTLDNVIRVYAEDIGKNTEKYYQVLCSKDTVWTTKDFLGMGEISLGLLMGNPEFPNAVSMIRKTGMKIKEYSPKSGLIPFVGILFINGKDINEYLRLMENPEHTKWEIERVANKAQARIVLKELNAFVNKQIEELASMSLGDQMDAVGVGAFLPDLGDGEESQEKEETISNTIQNITSKKSRKSAIASYSDEGELEEKQFDDEGEENDSHLEHGGEDKGWIHGDGSTPRIEPSDPTDVHVVAGGDEVKATYSKIGYQKVIFIAVDKNKGTYMLLVVPNTTCQRGMLELNVSAETNKYPAPVKSASIMGKALTVSGNKVSGFSWEKNKPVRIKLEIDFYDYCSMEVKAYAY